MSPIVSFAKECPIGFKRPNYPTRANFCQGGKVPDYYNFDKEIPCSDMEVDHLIPLKFAHCYGLSDEQLKRFANDPKNLRFTHWKTNRSKGAKTLEEFVNTLEPSMKSRALIDGIEVLEDYNLPLNKPLRKMLVSTVKEQRTQLAKFGKRRIPALVNFKGEMVPPKRAIKKTGEGIAKRTSIFAARELAILPLENLPFVGLGFSLAFIGWDLKDACDTVTDINELESSLFPDEQPKFDESEVCGLTVPSVDEVKQAMTDTERLTELYEEMKKSVLETQANIEFPALPEVPELKLPELQNPLKKLWGD